jgi:5-methylcytosine-specific restriction endonuclease McrA
VGLFIASNLQGLCRSCHGLKTEEDKAHTGAWPDAVAIETCKPKRVYTF